MARKPWCRVLYWFAMLIDAERIEREVEDLRYLSRGKLRAAEYHEPERVWRAYDDALAALRQPLPTMTEDELIAYALKRQAERKAEAAVS